MQITTSVASERRLVTPAQALYSPEYLALPQPAKPDQAAGLLIARHRFPLPTVLVLGRRMVLVSDIHAFVDALRPLPPAVHEAPRRRRGRPTNAEVAARRAAALTAEKGQGQRRLDSGWAGGVVGLVGEDIHRVIDSLDLDEPMPDQETRRQRGPMSKAEKAARQAAARVEEVGHD